MTEDDIEEMLWDSCERQTEILVPKAEKPFVPYQKQLIRRSRMRALFVCSKPRLL